MKAVLAILVAAGAVSLAGQKPELRPPDVLDQPTPMDAVHEMLKVAEVGPGDIVYDLGSGDGRIVIAAAREYGARGIGIDIDPLSIWLSNEHAKDAGVTDRVQFRHEDLFEANISDATVVTMYLLPALNLKLRPRLLADLKPGTRLVSYTWDMGDWAPEKTIDVKGYKVYLWRVPERR
jgi:SAM-dependent methyltransferase